MEKEEDGDQIKKMLEELRHVNFITEENRVTARGAKILKSVRGAIKIENEM